MQPITSSKSEQTVEHLRTFLGRWADIRIASTPARRLGDFLRKAHPLLKSSRQPEQQPQHKLDPDRLGRILVGLSRPLAAARRRGDALDIWEVAGLNRDEVRTARVLTWLLDPHGSHGAGDAYLQALWAEIRGDRAFNFSLQDPQRAIRENYPLGDRENRVDVEVVGGNFLLFIEVKIDAVEGLNQVSRYSSLAAKKAASLGRQHWAVLYLSEKAPDQQIERCLHIRWRDIARAIKSATKQLGKDDFSTKVSLLFARHVAQLH